MRLGAIAAILVGLFALVLPVFVPEVPGFAFAPYLGLVAIAGGAGVFVYLGTTKVGALGDPRA